MRRTLAAALAAVCLVACTAAADGVALPEGYRLSEYKAPVPTSVPGAHTIADAAAHALWQSGRVAFVDVLPDLPRPKGLPADAVWQGRSRFSVPGSYWLPNTGIGDPDTAMLHYFAAGLQRATDGDPSAPLVIFCRADCWMSWNAAKRAGEMGYTHVFWYPAGTDGWTHNNWPTKKLKRVQID